MGGRYPKEEGSFEEGALELGLPGHGGSSPRERYLLGRCARRARGAAKAEGGVGGAEAGEGPCRPSGSGLSGGAGALRGGEGRRFAFKEAPSGQRV